MKISENQFPINSPFISSIYEPLGGLPRAYERGTGELETSSVDS